MVLQHAYAYAILSIGYGGTTGAYGSRNAAPAVTHSAAPTRPTGEHQQSRIAAAAVTHSTEEQRHVALERSEAAHARAELLYTRMVFITVSISYGVSWLLHRAIKHKYSAAWYKLYGQCCIAFNLTTHVTQAAAREEAQRRGEEEEESERAREAEEREKEEREREREREREKERERVAAAVSRAEKLARDLAQREADHAQGAMLCAARTLCDSAMGPGCTEVAYGAMGEVAYLAIEMVRIDFMCAPPSLSPPSPCLNLSLSFPFSSPHSLALGSWSTRRLRYALPQRIFLWVERVLAEKQHQWTLDRQVCVRARQRDRERHGDSERETDRQTDRQIDT
eukprot:948255-Rhodomonas_salina.2